MSTVRLLFFLVASFATPLASAEPPAPLPDLTEVRNAALRYANLDGAPDRWSRRARWRNIVPQISATIGWVDEINEGTDFTEYLTRDAAGDLLFDSARTSNDASEKFRLYYSVRAMIDFRGLVFDRDELAAAREARAYADRRQLLVTLVHETYFERLDLAEQQSSATVRDPLLLRRMRVLDARLDGLTGGWFSTRTQALGAQ